MIKKTNKLLQKKAGPMIPIESLAPDVQEKIMEVFNKQKAGESEENLFSRLGDDSNNLESLGVFIFNGDITKDSLAHMSTKLLELHYNPDFDDIVDLYINSPGGELDATWAFIDLMTGIRVPIRTIAMGEIASGATMIFVAGDERVMAPNSNAMIHHFSAGYMGSYKDLVAARKGQDIETKKIIRHFIHHSKFKTEKEILKYVLLDQDNYLSPAEMKKYGLCDKILKSKPRR
jgi:ATP-dependent Clp protease protease subunit